ncbi:MAG: hypothetical protein EBZ69_04560, partial [Alphaproteobacteria bacterium]|nr:hypothetical protein [Alphaproteobacteria bacterium]
DFSIAGIVSCFKRFDIEFTDNDGVRRTKDTVVHYLGQDGFHDYVNDVYTELQRLEDKVIRICGVEDRLFVKALGNKADEHLKRMNSLQGLHFKAIASDINKSMKLGYIEYRTIPNLSFQIQFSVYGDRYDFILFGETKDYPKVVAIRSKIVAQAYREQFDALWNIAQKDG